MPEFDEKVLDVFLEKQLQLFPEEVAATREEAKDFLDECIGGCGKRSQRSLDLL